jgi:hypothetical protein
MDAAQVYHAYVDAEKFGDKDAMAALIAPGIQIDINGLPALESAAEEASAVTLLFKAYPGYYREIIEIIEDGNRAAIRWRMVGTVIEEYRDRLTDLDLRGCSFVEVVGGQMTRAYVWTPSSAFEDVIAIFGD